MCDFASMRLARRGVLGVVLLTKAVCSKWTQPHIASQGREGSTDLRISSNTSSLHKLATAVPQDVEPPDLHNASVSLAERSVHGTSPASKKQKSTSGEGIGRPKSTSIENRTQMPAHDGHQKATVMKLPVGAVPAKDLRQRRATPFSRIKSGIDNAEVAQASKAVLVTSTFSYTVTQEEWVVLVVSSALLLVIELTTLDSIVTHELLRNVLNVALWLALAGGYGLIIGLWSGWPSCYLWWDGYLLDWLLSFDNLFAFHLVITHFKVPPSLQRKAIVCGVVGAGVMRIAFYGMFSIVFRGISWLQPVCGVFLIYTAICTLRDEDEDMTVENVYLVAKLRSLLGSRLDTKYDEEGGGLWRYDGTVTKVTPLMLVIVVLWFIDTMFAVDSVSAKVVEIPSQFLACSSSTLALLGMGAMYPILQQLVEAAAILKYAVSAVLLFIGVQLILTKLTSIPSLACLAVLGAALVWFLLGLVPKLVLHGKA